MSTITKVDKTQRKKRKQPTETKRQQFLPRIVKSDIRRQYGTMFANVYNSPDFDYMKDFMDTFCNQDVTFIVQEGFPCNN
jgi:hypothetical protein